MTTFFAKKKSQKKVMAIFVDSGISRQSLFCSGGDESYYVHMCPTTLKFQDIAYTVDAVVLYVSVAVEL